VGRASLIGTVRINGFKRFAKVRKFGQIFTPKTFLTGG
jgi:hypothetical protein